MPNTITDTTKNPITLTSGATTTPFSAVGVYAPLDITWDSLYGGGAGTLTITLHALDGSANVGTLADPGVPYVTVSDLKYIGNNTYTERTSGGPHTPPFLLPNAVLDRITYTAPTLDAGQTEKVEATVSFTGVQSNGATYPTHTQGVTMTVSDPTPVVLETHGPDALTLPPPPPVAAPQVEAPPPAAPSPVAAPPVEAPSAAGPPPAAPPPAVAPPAVAQPGGSAGGGNFIIANQTTGQQTVAAGAAYSGPVSGLEREFILVTADNVNITAQVPNVFIHSGSGTDALDVSKSNGNNVLDGGSGSNFLTGGTGFDTFFLDYRNPTVDLFSTIVNFHSGDNLTIFGINQTDYMLKLLDNQGAVNAKGLDFAVDAAGKPHGNVVLAGFSNADIGSGKLTLSYGRTQDLPGLPGSEYLNIHGT